MIEVLSSGGGTQSNCMLALVAQGLLPRPDIVVIADTDRECQSTWDYLNSVTIPEMAKIGIEIFRVGPEYQSMPEHGKYWMSHNDNTMIIPAFTNQTGEAGKLSGFCSARWKVEVVNRFLSQNLGITRSKYRKWIGFSADEWRRASKIMAGEEGRKGLIRLPLVHDRYMKRHECIKAVEDMGWPTPPRSRCWMCPNQGDGEWLEMRENRPEEFRKAVDFENEIQREDPFAWLHKSCTPLDQVDFSPEPSLFDSGNYCSSGVCFV